MTDSTFKNFKNIIFDLGGVIMDISIPITEKEFSRLSGADIGPLFGNGRHSEIFENFETGEYTADEFREKIRRALNIKISDKEFDRTWNMLLLHFPAQRIELLKKLKKEKRTFLLSNTNSIHVQAFEKIYRDEFKSELKDLFEDLFYSHNLKDRKPNTSIYKRVLDTIGIDPKDTLFIDDNLDNVIGARNAGLNAYHLTNGQCILELDFF